jgi:hypothetical protein
MWDRVVTDASDLCGGYDNQRHGPRPTAEERGGDDINVQAG